ncbi:hypothetical protein ACOME3_010698 [Neoechinorhynchus agilis]
MRIPIIVLIIAIGLLVNISALSVLPETKNKITPFSYYSDSPILFKSRDGENQQKDDESDEMSSGPPMMDESSSNQGDFNDIDSSEENEAISKPGENQQKDDESDEMSSGPPTMYESSSNQGDFNDFDSSEENKGISKPGENLQNDDESDEMSSRPPVMDESSTTSPYLKLPFLSKKDADIYYSGASLYSTILSYPGNVNNGRLQETL